MLFKYNMLQKIVSMLTLKFMHCLRRDIWICETQSWKNLFPPDLMLREIRNASRKLPKRNLETSWFKCSRNEISLITSGIYMKMTPRSYQPNRKPVKCSNNGIVPYPSRAEKNLHKERCSWLFYVLLKSRRVKVSFDITQQLSNC